MHQQLLCLCSGLLLCTSILGTDQALFPKGLLGSGTLALHHALWNKRMASDRGSSQRVISGTDYHSVKGHWHLGDRSCLVLSELPEPLEGLSLVTFFHFNRRTSNLYRLVRAGLILSRFLQLNW